MFDGSLLRRLFEVAGFALIGLGAWLVAPALGLMVAGLALLNWSYRRR